MSVDDKNGVSVDLERKVAGLFADVFDFPRESIHDALDPEHVPQWDSLGHVRLVSAIEEAFAIQLEIEEIMALTTFGAIVDVLGKRSLATG